MSDHPCEICTRPVGDAKVCVRCRNGLERDLGDVDALTEQLEIVLCRQTAYAERNGPRSSERPLPVDLRASEAAWVLRNTLTTWCRVLAWDGTASTNSDLSGWLLGKAEAIRHHSAAAECIDEIGSAVAMVRVVIDAPANRTTFLLSKDLRCPEDGCDGELRVFIPAVENVTPRIQCGDNPEHALEPYQWMRAGHRILKKRDERKAS
jgi:DNA-binding transcriptional LysR family regulator